MEHIKKKFSNKVNVWSASLDAHKQEPFRLKNSETLLVNFNLTTMENTVSSLNIENYE